MKRQVQWGRPMAGRGTDVVRLSKDGRFRIRSMRMASARNGCWNERAYSAERADGRRIGPLNDTFQDALDAVELENDPNWEPS